MRSLHRRRYHSALLNFWSVWKILRPLILSEASKSERLVNFLPDHHHYSCFVEVPVIPCLSQVIFGLCRALSAPVYVSKSVFVSMPYLCVCLYACGCHYFYVCTYVHFSVCVSVQMDLHPSLLCVFFPCSLVIESDDLVIIQLVIAWSCLCCCLQKLSKMTLFQSMQADFIHSFLLSYAEISSLVHLNPDLSLLLLCKVVIYALHTFNPSKCDYCCHCLCMSCILI